MKTIMIVDDSASARLAIKTTLQLAGYGVVEAADGRDALKRLSTTDVDGVLTDLNMPVMNGLEFVRQYKATPRGTGVPVVFVTTESDDAFKKQARQAGALGWLMKPFNPEQLTAVVRKVAG